MTLSLNIIGAGRVGCSLARLWTECGVFCVQDVLNATTQSTRRAVTFIGAGRARDSLAGLSPARVWLIGVHDSAIESVATSLADQGNVAEGDVVFHCSGSLGAATLSPLARAGARTASVHPVRSFVTPIETMAGFAGTWCALEGSSTALTMLGPALEKIGAQILRIDAANKLLYHAASVYSCNYLSALMEVALRAVEVAGVDRDTGLKMLEPLVRGTVDNLFTHGPASALTGPIARGDHKLVGRQLAALERWRDDYASLYRSLGQVATELAVEKGRVCSADLEGLSKVLNTNPAR